MRVLSTMVLCGGALLGASCIVLTGRTGDRIRFDPAVHAEFMGDCDRCHEGVAGPQVGTETRRALEASCLACHSDRKDDCAYCHTDVGNVGRFPTKERGLWFSHETHLERVGGECEACHPGAHGLEPTATVDAGASEGAAATALRAHAAAAVIAPSMPAHAECFACHEMQEFHDQLECRNCHQELARYGMRPYQQFSHTAEFVRRGHAELLRSTGNAATCAQCHEQSSCDDCHQAEGGEAARLPPGQRLPEKAHLGLIHRGDYIFRHPWEARADPASCVKCHSPSYCRDCHDGRGISAASAATRTDGFQFHGPGVLFPGSPDFHGTLARRDPVSCAACHEDSAASNCTSCHREGAFGGNPHPPGFRSRLDKRSAAVCRLCHAK